MNYYTELVIAYTTVTMVSLGAGWILARLVRSKPVKPPEYSLYIPPRPQPKTELHDFKSLCEHGK